MPVAEKHTICFGPFELDLHSGELRKNGTRLKLQPQPVQILEVLLEHPGELVTREELRKRLWPEDTFVDFEQGLNTAIKKLRQALCDEAETPRYIETLPRRGYRFIGEVSTSAPAQQPSIAVSVIHLHPRSRRFRIRLTALVACALIAAAAAYSRFWRPTMPHVAAAHRLTATPYAKETGCCMLATDGSRLYATELHGHLSLSEVAVSGGETTEIELPDMPYPAIRDIAPDGSALLVNDRMTGKGTWLVPLPGGPARPLPKTVGVFALFGDGGRSILHTGIEGNDFYRSSVDFSSTQELFELPVKIWHPRVSPAGDRMRFTSGGLWEVRMDGTHLHRLFGEEERDEAPDDWSRDGRLFVFQRFDGVRWNLFALRERDHWFQTPTSQPIQLTFGPLSLAGAVLNRDGTKLYALGTDQRGELTAYRQKSAESGPYLNGISADFLGFSRDRQWVVYVKFPQETLWRSRIDGSDRMQLTFAEGQRPIYPSWSPDGKLIVYCDFLSHTVYVVPADGGSPMLLLSSIEFKPADPSWFPDGKSIAYGGCPKIGGCKEVSEVRIFNMETRQSTTVPGSQGFFAPRVSPDGKYIAAQTDDLRTLWLFAFSDKRWVELLEGKDTAGWAAWSADSKYIYVNRDNQAIVRIRVSDRSTENVLSLKDIRLGGGALAFVGWFGVAPDDRILLLRDTSIEDIYALDLEYR